MAGIVGSVDRAQRRWSGLGVPIATIYKFGDDQGAYLAAIITYYAFISVFPLLLLSTSILGFVLQGNPGLRHEALNSALTQVPIIGDQLGRPEGLTGSTAAVIVGAVVAVYGSLGLGTATQNAMNVCWSVPRNKRPNPILLRLKSLGLLLFTGTAFFAITTFSVIAQSTRVFGDAPSTPFKWAVSLLTVLLIALMLTLLFRLAAAREHPWWYAAPGGLLVAVLWQVLQLLSTAYVHRTLTETSSMNKTFGLVLGLVGLLFLASAIAVIGIELNVVITRRLWPRSLLTPFTDAVVLTPADEKAYTSYALMQQYKGFERVSVSFDRPARLEVESEPVAQPEPEPEPEPETNPEPEQGPEPPPEHEPVNEPEPEPPVELEPEPQREPVDIEPDSPLNRVNRRSPSVTRLAKPGENAAKQP